MNANYFIYEVCFRHKKTERQCPGVEDGQRREIDKDIANISASTSNVK